MARSRVTHHIATSQQSARPVIASVLRDDVHFESQVPIKTPCKKITLGKLLDNSRNCGLHQTTVNDINKVEVDFTIIGQGSLKESKGALQ